MALLLQLESLMVFTKAITSLAGPNDDVVLPAGSQGPAFLVLRNFEAFYRYNAAESYGLAIAHLSDRLRGAGPFSTPWPTDDPGLSRAQRRQLQELLVRRGHDIGEIDGRLGERSRHAIRMEQQRLGLRVQQVLGQVGEHMGRRLAQRGQTLCIAAKSFAQVKALEIVEIGRAHV